MNATRKPGFTLVELLVVIAVIALLVAILAPSLTHVRSGGKEAQCTANLHNWETALGNVTADQKLGKPARLSVTSWTANLLPYVSGDVSLLRCPEESRELGAVRMLDDIANNLGTYYFLDTFSGGTPLYKMPMQEGPSCLKENVTATGYDLSFEDQRDGSGNPIGDKSFKNPIMHVEISANEVTMSVAPGGYGGYIWNLIDTDGKVLIANIMKTPDTSPGGAKASVTVSVSPSASYGMNSIASGFSGTGYITFLDYQSNVAYVVDNDHELDLAKWEGEWKVDGQYVFARHFGKVNVAFGDGSVKLMSIPDIEPTAANDLSVRLWGGQK